jgi:hypothetical protein
LLTPLQTHSHADNFKIVACCGHNCWMKSEPGPPMTLGSAAAAGVRLIIWCKACQHQVEPDPAETAARYGPETTVLDWRARLVCSEWRGSS